MSEGDKELLARISQLAGQINRRKNEQAGITTRASQPPHHTNSYTRGSFRSRGYRVGRPTTHRHRTLVLNNGTQTPTSSTSDTPSTPDGTSWVSKTDRHLQLINSAVFEKESQNRTRAIEETRRQKQRQRDDAERAKFFGYIQARGIPAVATNVTGTSKPSRFEVDVNGVRFVVAKNGSKLVKISGRTGNGDQMTDGAAEVRVGDSTATPKMAIVGGVKFYRSKNGNLYRDGVLRAQRKFGAVKKLNEPCKAFSTTGSCSKGPRCRYTHDADRVAVCKDFLLKGTCGNGEDCDLSHELSPRRTPTCLHHLKGSCANPNCHYAHSSVSAGAPICRAFGIYGYCEKGLDCVERHAFECPDFANSGVCRTKGCKLLHRERASVLRKTQAREAGDDDMSSEDESVDSDDVDSDEVDEFLGADDGASDLGQKDYISF